MVLCLVQERVWFIYSSILYPSLIFSLVYFCDFYRYLCFLCYVIALFFSVGYCKGCKCFSVTSKFHLRFFSHWKALGIKRDHPWCSVSSPSFATFLGFSASFKSVFCLIWLINSITPVSSHSTCEMKPTQLWKSSHLFNSKISTLI